MSKTGQMTVTVAYLAGLYVTKAPFGLAAFAALTPVVFSIVEYRQELLQNALSERASDLENALQRLDRRKDDAAIISLKRDILRAANFVPGLAMAINSATRTRKYKRIKQWETRTFYTSEILLVLGAACVLNLQSAASKRTDSDFGTLNKEVETLVATTAKLDDEFIQTNRNSSMNTQNFEKSLNSLSSELHLLSTGLFNQSHTHLSSAAPSPVPGPNKPVLSEQPYEFKLGEGM